MIENSPTMRFFLSVAIFMALHGVAVADEAHDAASLNSRALNGDTTAQFQLGVFALSKDKNSAEAAKWVRKAAESDHAGAQNYLAAMYQSGNGVPQDYKEALRWLRKSSSRGDADAAFNLGLLYLEGRGVSKNYSEARRWLQIAADRGNIESLRSLASIYAYGKGTPKDPAKALSLLRIAADNGNSAAEAGIGFIYQAGLGVPKDLDEAFRWFRLAAEHGNIIGQRALGTAYLVGAGTDRDFALAEKWLRPAAEQGDAIAQSNLGVMFFSGYGVRQDYDEAIKWFRLAAAQDHGEALHNLGSAYAKGLGVAQDFRVALNYFRRAARLGFKPSEPAINQILSEHSDAIAAPASAATKLVKASHGIGPGDKENIDTKLRKLTRAFKMQAPQFKRLGAKMVFIEQWRETALPEAHTSIVEFIGYTGTSADGKPADLRARFKVNVRSRTIEPLNKSAVLLWYGEKLKTNPALFDNAPD